MRNIGICNNMLSGEATMKASGMSDISLRGITVGKEGNQEDWLQKTKEPGSLMLPGS